MVDVNLENFKESLKKYYVYALIDPDDISNRGIFYIGKGTDKRGKDHANEALKYEDIESDNEDDSSTMREGLKIERIRKIFRKTKQRPLVRVLMRSDNEREAFAVESILISFVFGLIQDGGQLSNAIKGHNSSFYRDIGDFDLMSHLDIPKTYSFDGTYKRELQERLIKSGVQAIAEEAIGQLRLMIQGSPRLKGKVFIGKPEVIESGKYVGAKVEFGEKDVILRLQFTPASLIINLRAKEEGKVTSKKGFMKRMQSLGLKTQGGVKNKLTGEKTGPDHYGWLPGWKGNPIKYTHYEEMISRIERAYDIFQA